MTRSSYSLRASILAASVFLFAIAPCWAERTEWKPTNQRRAELIKLANTSGLQRASKGTVQALNREYGLNLKPTQVRIVPFSSAEDPTFWKFVEKAKCLSLGAAVMPHQGGPHSMLLVGDYIRDSIDPGIDRRFIDNTKTRQDTFGKSHDSPRIFCLWNATTSALTKVGLESEGKMNDKRYEGINCAQFVLEPLANEGNANSGSPFAGLQPTGWPEKGLRRLLEKQPDMVIQVVPKRDYDIIMANHANHEIRFWY
jgi:hypothetical protein